eukprot:CAMPEP_0116932996 /NCGR_PEP_ID=MMETSP0467-20121206/28770_1 /TAXON_ID=283647 /ORGANISM="Mesodinium pulex, Strain SPMC105" /LENGTH=409 /DNA_ID=CAMNT_0004613785 /DNA_START=27 /DNA_END=1254 /DNA_ORIENTATION=-
MAAVRPLVSIYNVAGEAAGETALPGVFSAPIRSDVVSFVHKAMSKNKRQAYAVSMAAGHQTSAESWGTGRAVARIPRVAGSGTHRAGQAAFGNMCRSGRMFAPTRTWRKWHQKINVQQRRAAMTAAIAATAVPALVMARGHKVDAVPEIPLVVSGATDMKKTKEAVELLNKLGADADINRCKASKKLRTGKGKMRNRRYVARRGPLVVIDSTNGIDKAIRNIPGVEIANVNRLNLLALAPGGHLGRFVIWTEDAFAKLDTIFTSNPSNVMAVPDLSRIINSTAIQQAVRPTKSGGARRVAKKNPLVNRTAMLKLNPYWAVVRASEKKAEEDRDANRAAKKAASRGLKAVALKAKRKAASKAYFAMVTSDEYAKPATFKAWVPPPPGDGMPPRSTSEHGDAAPAGPSAVP